MASGNNVLGFVPFGRVNVEKRTVEGVITSEAVDSYDTFFDYDATKRTIFAPRGFDYWRNLRAMHAPVAAGVVQDIRCDDVARKVEVTARVVDDAEWEKVKAGVYKGFSIAGVARSSVKEERDGKQVTRFTDYDLLEVSLVDRPSNPDAQITLFRMDLDDAAFMAKWDAMGAGEALNLVMGMLTGKIAEGSVQDAQTLKPAVDALVEYLAGKVAIVSDSADKLAGVAAASAAVEEVAEGEVSRVAQTASNAGSVSVVVPSLAEPEIITPENVARAIAGHDEFVRNLSDGFLRVVLASNEFVKMAERVAGSEGRLLALEKRAAAIDTNSRVAGPVLREITSQTQTGDNATAQIVALRSALDNTPDHLAKQAIQQEIARLEIRRVHVAGGHTMSA